MVERMRKRRAAHLMEARKERKRGIMPALVGFLLLSLRSHPGPPTYGMVPPTIRVGFLPLFP
jgi:hypothetical protein